MLIREAMLQASSGNGDERGRQEVGGARSPLYAAARPDRPKERRGTMGQDREGRQTDRVNT